MTEPINRDELLRQVAERRSDKEFMARLEHTLHENADIFARLRDNCGAPLSGTPGGHIGEYLTFASCRRCGAEWVWVAAGVPSTMRNCGCPYENVVTVDFRAVRHGYLSDAPSSEQRRSP